MSERIKKRGFGSMSAARKKEVASSGGKAAWAKNVAHQFTSKEGRDAGAKGLITRRAAKNP